MQHQTPTTSSIDKSLSRNLHNLRSDPQKQYYLFIIWNDLQQAGACSLFDEQGPKLQCLLRVKEDLS